MEAFSPASDGMPVGAAQMRQRKDTPSLFMMRPISTVTDFEDLWDADDSGSEFEEDSPRESFDSGMDRSQTTASSIQTPAVEQKNAFDVRIQRQNSVSYAPNGPDLYFRTTIDPANDIVFQMSPILPKDVESQFENIDDAFDNVATPRPLDTAAPLDHQDEFEHVPDFHNTPLLHWTSQQVAAWMQSAGFEDAIISKFEENDIDGEVLLALQFEDLKELGITSFGKRHQIWNELGQLREEGPISPATTAFEDNDDSQQPCISAPEGVHSTAQRRGRREPSQGMDPVAPADSVSIVAIEQLIPKPHKCSRGERCPKWRKQQRLLQTLDQEHGLTISPTEGGHIFLAGNPGNAQTSERIIDNVYRPTSEAPASVVASSDLLGPGQLPQLRQLEAGALDNVIKRDPQENVKNFLAFQHLQTNVPDDTPPSPLVESPRYEMFPPLPSIQQQQQQRVPTTPLENLRDLPRLSIPTKQQRTPHFSRREIVEPAAPIRLGTPASEADVPVTTIDLTLDRDASQSVPPNMQFRAPVQRRPSSKGAPTWRRPSFQLPTVRENVPEEHQVPALPGSRAADYGDDTTQAGWMKKRKARLLRHEWNEHHFRLAGTQLAMHKSDSANDVRPLEQIDVDKYTIACSSLTTDSKLASAMKSLRLATGKKGSSSIDDAAFAFSLVPAAERQRLMGLVKDGPKSQHFLVTSRDQRIDWMRSIMLAKAVHQKEHGCDVVINGQKQ